MIYLKCFCVFRMLDYFGIKNYASLNLSNLSKYSSIPMPILCTGNEGYLSFSFGD